MADPRGGRSRLAGDLGRAGGVPGDGFSLATDRWLSSNRSLIARVPAALTWYGLVVGVLTSFEVERLRDGST
jgi:hypothetical protein